MSLTSVQRRLFLSESDQRLRELERRWKESGSKEDQEAYSRAQDQAYGVQTVIRARVSPRAREFGMTQVMISHSDALKLYDLAGVDGSDPRNYPFRRRDVGYQITVLDPRSVDAPKFIDLTWGDTYAMWRAHQLTSEAKELISWIIEANGVPLKVIKVRQTGHPRFR